MFAPHDPNPRVDIQVIARGDSPRLRACVGSLVAHAAEVPFSITCVVNPVGRHDSPLDDLPDGVRVLTPRSNLGWGGGLHLARAHTSAPLLVWAQEDMVVADGWLDALVATADRHPRAGAVGSAEVDPETRLANGHAGGYAEPPDRVGEWNATDVLRAGDAVHGVPLDWITSKGMLTRAEAFDEVGGTDPRLFPLNHVDKDYGTHLRSHGWQLLLCPEAQLFHEGSRSSPPLLRRFLPGWQEPDFDARWGDVVRRLGRGGAEPVDHECSPWTAGDVDEIERLAGREATVVLVPFSRFAATELDTLRAERDAARADLAEALTAFRGSTSWRVTAPLRALGRLIPRRRD